MQDAGAVFAAPARYQPSRPAYHASSGRLRSAAMAALPRPLMSRCGEPRPAPAGRGLSGLASLAWYNDGMEAAAVGAVVATRRPRFRRTGAPPPFRLTPDDVEIVRVVARHRLIRSIHIAALVGRSLDRTNDRLLRLFHAGYVDRPRAQLDHYPVAGSAPMIYALADRGVRLLRVSMAE